jgi:hypothetical protein
MGLRMGLFHQSKHILAQTSPAAGEGYMTRNAPWGLVIVKLILSWEGELDFNIKRRWCINIFLPPELILLKKPIYAPKPHVSSNLSLHSW